MNFRLITNFQIVIILLDDHVWSCKKGVLFWKQLISTNFIKGANFVIRNIQFLRDLAE